MTDTKAAELAERIERAAWRGVVLSEEERSLILSRLRPVPRGWQGDGEADQSVDPVNRLYCDLADPCAGPHLTELQTRCEAAEKERDALKAEVERLRLENMSFRSYQVIDSNHIKHITSKLDHACAENDKLTAELQSIKSKVEDTEGWLPVVFDIGIIRDADDPLQVIVRIQSHILPETKVKS